MKTSFLFWVFILVAGCGPTKLDKTIIPTPYFLPGQWTNGSYETIRGYYNQRIIEVGQDLGIPVFNTDSVLNPSNSLLYVSDSLHLSDYGESAVCAGLEPYF